MFPYFHGLQDGGVILLSGLLGQGSLQDNLVAQLDTLIADVYSWPCYQLGNIILTFSAEGAVTGGITIAALLCHDSASSSVFALF
jgi:hypothetical protein